MNRIYFPVVASLLIALIALPTSKANAAKEMLPGNKQPEPNAALFYWQAFALLPQLDAQQTKLVDQAIKQDTTNAQVEKILNRCQHSFELAKLVSPQMTCDWGIVQKGPMTHLPHLGKAKMLARLCVLQAKRNLSNNQHKKAVQNIQSALLIGRHVDQGAIVCLLVGNAIKKDVMDGLRSSGQPIHPSVAKDITQFFSRLPKSATLKGAIMHEGNSFSDWLQKAFKNGTPEAKKQLQQFLEMGNQSKRTEGESPYSALSQERILSDISGLRQLFAGLAQISESSPKNQPSEIAAWKKKVDKSGNTFAIFLPDAKVLDLSNRFDKNWSSFQKELTKLSKN